MLRLIYTVDHCLSFSQDLIVFKDCIALIIHRLDIGHLLLHKCLHLDDVLLEIVEDHRFRLNRFKKSN